MLIADDIGGTKTDLAIYSIESGPHAPPAQAQFHGADYPSLPAGDPRNPSELCRATVNMLVSILASEAGNLALKVLATGGVYLAGGITLHLLGALKEQQFMQGFAGKGRFKDLMDRVPVHVITARAALVGAASFGLETYKHQSGVAA